MLNSTLKNEANNFYRSETAPNILMIKLSGVELGGTNGLLQASFKSPRYFLLL